MTGTQQPKPFEAIPFLIELCANAGTKTLTEHASRAAADYRLMSDTLRGVTLEKTQAYAERNRLVALLSKLFPASLERHPEEDKDWDPEWRWIVFIDFGFIKRDPDPEPGVLSWHIHDSELDQFEHLERQPGRHKWDGHTTMAKYVRLGDIPPGYRPPQTTTPRPTRG